MGDITMTRRKRHLWQSELLQPKRDPADTHSFHRAQNDFRIALCDSFNTPQAIYVLLDIIGKTNVYFSKSREYNIGVIETIAEYITRQLVMFGLGEGGANGETGAIGWGKEGEGMGMSGDVSYLDRRR